MGTSGVVPVLFQPTNRDAWGRRSAGPSIWSRGAACRCDSAAALCGHRGVSRQCRLARCGRCTSNTHSPWGRVVPGPGRTRGLVTRCASRTNRALPRGEDGRFRSGHHASGSQLVGIQDRLSSRDADSGTLAVDERISRLPTDLRFRDVGGSNRGAGPVRHFCQSMTSIQLRANIQYSGRSSPEKCGFSGRPVFPFELARAGVLGRAPIKTVTTA